MLVVFKICYFLSVVINNPIFKPATKKKKPIELLQLSSLENKFKKIGILKLPPKICNSLSSIL